MGNQQESPPSRGGLKHNLIWPFIGLLCLNLFLSGCGVRGNDSRVLTEPLYVGVGYDVSRSVATAHLPQFTSNHLDRLIGLVNKSGGVVSVGIVDELAFEPLAKLQVLRVAGRLDERAQINQKNHESEKAFKADVASKISVPRNARATDINGSIARFSLFLDEPTIPANARRVVIFISDGIDTGPWRRLAGVRLPAGVKVFVVGMERTLAVRLFGKNAVLFESIDSALDGLKDYE